MTLEQRASQLWPNNPAYQKQWIAIVTWLGERWLLFNQQLRKGD